MIDTQAIRNKILDLAIRGKLTEQLPEDGSAEDFYQQILKEKRKLISSGTFKKDKILPEIETEEEPYPIPETWKWVRLGSVSEISGGKTASSSETTESGLIPYFKVSDMNVAGNETHMNVAGNYVLKSYSGKIFPVGTIIFPKNGGAALTNKRRILTVDSAVDLNTGGCTPAISSMTAWIKLYLDTVDFGEINTGSNIPTVNATALKKRLFPLPPLAEQHRIVERIEQAFSALDTIDALQAQYADNLTVLKTKLLEAAIQGKLTDQLPEDGTAEELYRQIQAQKQALIKAGKIKKEKPLSEITADEIPFEIPANWKWVRLASISSIINGDRGKNYPAKSTLKHEGIPFISALNLNGVSVTQDEHLLCLDNRQYELLGNGKLQKDDIVICIRGSLGKHGRYPFDKGAIASSLVICRLFYSKEIIGDYVMTWLDSSAFPAEIKRYDSGTAQPNLAANSLEQFLIPLPPLAEQKRIVAKLETLLPLCERMK